MATIQQIKDAINNANTLGRTNLAEKGVTVDDTATTYQIMQKISETSDVFVITASGAISNCTVDKPYIEILSAAQAGKTIILLFPKPFSTEYWILSPYRINNDRSGTFRCITPSDIEYEGDSEYLLFVTIYPDNTVQARQERLIKELDHRITFKADGQDYQIITVKDGQSVSAPSPNPTSESGTFAGWLNALSGESVTFPLTPTEDLWLNAEFIQLLSDKLYVKFNIDKSEYPYVAVLPMEMSVGVYYYFIKFAKTMKQDSVRTYFNDCLSGSQSNVIDFHNDTAENIVNGVLNNGDVSFTQTSSEWFGVQSDEIVCINNGITKPSDSRATYIPMDA